MKNKTTLATLCIACFLATGSAKLDAQTPAQAEKLLEAARHKEVVDGDLKAAIEQYRRIAGQFSKVPEVAARALYQLGQCQEKDGQAAARKSYERIVREYGSAQQYVSAARARLAALGEAAPAGQRATRVVWTGPKVDRYYSSLSPDGRFISFPDWDTGNLALHDLVTGADRQLTDTGTWKKGEKVFAEASAISRDGKQVAYSWYDQKLGRYELRIVGINGKPKPRRVFEKPEISYLDPRDWSPDGNWIAAYLESTDGTQQIALIGAKDGSLRILKSLDRVKTMFLSVRGLSPDGKHLVYTTRTVQGSVSRGYILSTDGVAEVPLISGTSSAQSPLWTPDGSRIVFASDRSGSPGLWSVRVADGKPLGDPELLNSDFDGDVNPMGFSRNGSIYYVVSYRQSDIYLAGLDPATGKLTSESRRVNEQSVGKSWGRISWLPDGRSLSFHCRQSPSDALVVHTISTREERVIWGGMSGRPGGGYWGWFADGKSLMAFSVEGQNEVFSRVDITTGQVQASWTVPKLGLPNGQRVISPDLMTLYYVRKDRPVCRDPQCANVILARDLETGRDREVFRTYGTNLNVPSISHDGRDLAFIAQGGSTKVLMVAPTAGGPPREIHRFPQEFPPNMTTAWTLDGGHVLVFSQPLGRQDGGGEVWSISTKGGSPERSPLSMQNVAQPVVSPDGTQVAFVGTNSKSEVWVMTGLFQDAKPAPKR